MRQLILVSGSRAFPNPDLIRTTIQQMIKPGDRLMHGGAQGVDILAAQAAHDAGAIILTRPANWSIYGKRAGIIRNEQMFREALQDPSYRIVIFWDGQSRGTKHMMDLCRSQRIPFELIQP